MKQIQLTNGQAVLVDDEDFEFLSRFRWHASKKRSGTYAIRNVKINGKWTMRPIHRLLMSDPVGMVVDHVNHDTLDNRKANLRICTNSNNGRNRKGPNAGSTSGVRGVTWHKQISRWLAQIKVGRKNIYIGVFISKEDATSAYAAANKKYFGEFGGEL